MEKPIFQKIFKKRKSRSGKTVLSQKKIGMLVAGIVDGKLTIGYSLCHKNDKCNYIRGKKVPGFERELAMNRAIKWKDDRSIKIPPSIAKDMEKFKWRCHKYYKGFEVPIISLITEPEKPFGFDKDSMIL